MAATGGFNFLRHAESRKCNSRKVQHTLLSTGVPKNDHERGGRTTENTLITADILKSGLSVGKLNGVLRCGCSICWPVTANTHPDDDKDLAAAIAGRHDRQQLFAALSFMGGFFAARLLHRHAFHTVEETLRGMPDRADLIRDLFRPFQQVWDMHFPASCCHPEPHTKDESLKCLQEAFLAQLKSHAWLFRIPRFSANNLLQQFGEKVKTPFVDEKRLSIGNRCNGREFFSFKVHKAYCEDEKLQGRLLFRKQLSIDTAEKLERSKQESSIVKFLKDLANPNIAEVLFAFQETDPPKLSLVFDLHPTDLQKILFPHLAYDVTFQTPEKTVERFPGSPLDNWMWIGILGIFDAVAAIHDPPHHAASIVLNSASKDIGGHFDIKPANIVIDAHGRFLLTDFGQAFFKRIQVGQESNFSVYPGTLDYRPPQTYGKPKANGILTPENGQWWSREYDLWSLACISIEVLTLIVYGAGAPNTFYEERKNEDRNGLGTFWKTDVMNGASKDVLKDSVRTRLSEFQNHGDKYLARVAEKIEEMFQIERKKSLTVKACHQELSASVKVDRYLFMGQNDEHIAGEGTYSCLKTMRTSFSVERVSPLRCALYLWRNLGMDKFTLTLEFAGSENQIIVKPSTTKANSDEFIPLAFFDPDTVFDQNRFRTNGLFLQCAFRNMHDGVTFHFAKREHYHHFFGAFTHQYIAPGSEFRFKSCVLESASKSSSKTWSSTNGHFQVWMGFTADSYDGRYRQASRHSIPSINLQLSPQLDLPPSPRVENGSSNRSSSNTKRSPNPHFRIALYLCGQPDRALAVVSLTHDTYHIAWGFTKKGAPRMLLERKSRQHILATVFDNPASAPATKLPQNSGPLHPEHEFPGVPMSEQVLLDSMTEGKGLRKVEVEFWNEDERNKFKAYYEKKFR